MQRFAEMLGDDALSNEIRKGVLSALSGMVGKLGTKREISRSKQESHQEGDDNA
jgi:hypothetical protein